MLVYAMLPLKGLLPLNICSPQHAQLLQQFAPPLTIYYSPFMQSQFIGEKQGDLLEQKCVKQKMLCIQDI